MTQQQKVQDVKSVDSIPGLWWDIPERHASWGRKHSSWEEKAFLLPLASYKINKSPVQLSVWLSWIYTSETGSQAINFALIILAASLHSCNTPFLSESLLFLDWESREPWQKGMPELSLMDESPLKSTPLSGSISQPLSQSYTTLASWSHPRLLSRPLPIPHMALSTCLGCCCLEHSISLSMGGELLTPLLHNYPYHHSPHISLHPICGNFPNKCDVLVSKATAII